MNAKELEEYWTPTQIISELAGRTDEMGEYIAAGPYDWSYAAVMYLRQAHARGERMCAFAATWCHPEHERYQEFDRYWSKRGYPVRTGAELR